MKLPVRVRLLWLEGWLGVKKKIHIWALPEKNCGFYDVLMSRNAIRPAIKSLDRKEALEFRKGIKKKDSLNESANQGDVMQGQAWTVRLEYHQISSWRLSSKIHFTSDGVKFILLIHCFFWRPVASFQRDTPVRHRVYLRSQHQIPSKNKNMLWIC